MAVGSLSTTAFIVLMFCVCGSLMTLLYALTKCYCSKKQRRRRRRRNRRNERLSSRHSDSTGSDVDSLPDSDASDYDSSDSGQRTLLNYTRDGRGGVVAGMHCVHDDDDSSSTASSHSDDDDDDARTRRARRRTRTGDVPRVNVRRAAFRVNRASARNRHAVHLSALVLEDQQGVELAPRSVIVGGVPVVPSAAATLH